MRAQGTRTPNLTSTEWELGGTHCPVSVPIRQGIDARKSAPVD